jgi:two-component system, response regulator PdtaR
MTEPMWLTDWLTNDFAKPPVSQGIPEAGGTHQGLDQMAYAATPTPHSIILIVEDEYLVRMNAAAMMEDAGFDVLEAGNADEALRLLEGNPDISIVFTDIEMPGSMNGLKLAHAVTGRWPPIRVIATSGRFSVRDGDLPSGGRFLPKPYNAAQILGALRDMGGGA